MTLEEAFERLSELGLMMVWLDKPFIGLALMTRDPIHPNEIVDVTTVRAQQDRWHIATSAVRMWADIADFSSIEEAVDFICSLYKPTVRSSDIMISTDESIAILDNAGLDAHFQKLPIPQIRGTAPWRINEGGWSKLNEFCIRRKLQGWLGIATLGNTVDFVTFGILAEVIKDICNYFRVKELSAQQQGTIEYFKN